MDFVLCCCLSYVQVRSKGKTVGYKVNNNACFRLVDEKEKVHYNLLHTNRKL